MDNAAIDRLEEIGGKIDRLSRVIDPVAAAAISLAKLLPDPQNTWQDLGRIDGVSGWSADGVEIDVWGMEFLYNKAHGILMIKRDVGDRELIDCSDPIDACLIVSKRWSQMKAELRKACENIVQYE
jgi:hypothetical protein